MVQLIEVAPNVWRVDKPSAPVARSSLPCPMVISDEMPPTEHVDGRFYTSKSAFRALTRAQGLTEVGNEKFKPKTRATADAKVKTQRREAVQRAAAQYRAGRRARVGAGAG
jgi:hypothetical protein